MVTNLVGTRIRELRSRKGWTQQQLSDKAELARATLATIEKDDSNPSLAAVYRIACAFGVTVDELLEQNQYRVSVIPAAKMSHLEAAGGAYRSTTVSPAGKQHMSQQIFHLQGGGFYQGKPHPPGSEEFLYIVQGRVELDVVGETVSLHCGDSAFFRANVKHSYANPAEEEAIGMVTIVALPDGS